MFRFSDLILNQGQGRIQRIGLGGKSWQREPNLPPFSSFSAELGHFILKLLNLDIYFLFC